MNKNVYFQKFQKDVKTSRWMKYHIKFYNDRTFLSKIVLLFKILKQFMQKCFLSMLGPIFERSNKLFNYESTLILLLHQSTYTLRHDQKLTH